MIQGSTPTEAFRASLNIETFDEDLYDDLVNLLTEHGRAIMADNATVYVEVLDDTGRMPL